MNGSDFVHIAIDDHTRPADSEPTPTGKTTSAGFLHRALAWFATHGVTA